MYARLVLELAVKWTLITLGVAALAAAWIYGSFRFSQWIIPTEEFFPFGIFLCIALSAVPIVCVFSACMYVHDNYYKLSEAKKQKSKKKDPSHGI